MDRHSLSIGRFPRTRVWRRASIRSWLGMLTMLATLATVGFPAVAAQPAAALEQVTSPNNPVLAHEDAPPAGDQERPREVPAFVGQGWG